MLRANKYILQYTIFYLVIEAEEAIPLVILRVTFYYAHEKLPMRKTKKLPLIIKPFNLSHSFLSKSILILLRLLIFVVLIGLFAGIVKTFVDLQMIFSTSVEESLRQLLLNVITLLAVVEVIRTALNYLTDGRVRVTYIVDTVLIVMLNEVLSLWFKGPSLESVLLLLPLIGILIVVRLLAIKYSPDHD